MELGFTVSKGPLSQISVPLFSLETAVHLAVGAYGWWKTRERTMSLYQLLESRNATISPPMTFDQEKYLSKRTEGVIRGVSFKEGALSTLDLPNASTATDKGITCLRALVTAFLCFYDERSVVQILADVVPRSMIRYELEGEDIVIEGPLLAAFRQYVHAAAVEEDSDILRGKLLDSIAAHQTRLGTRHSIGELLGNSISSAEGHMMTGMVNWVLKSRKEEYWYPTRSFRVWALAIVLSELGFEVQVADYIVQSKQDYESYNAPSNQFNGYPKVVLVGASVGDTDQHEADQRVHSLGDLLSKPQLIPIHAIPLVLFAHISSYSDYAHPYNFPGIWNFVYDACKTATGELYLSNSGLVGIDINVESAVISSDHRKLIDQWSPHLTRLISHAVDHFIPQLQYSTKVGEYRSFMSSRNFGMAVEEDFGTEAATIWHVMANIVLAVTFAIACKGLRSDGSPASPITRIAISSDFLYSRKVETWAKIIGLVLNGTATPSQWTGLLLELGTGVKNALSLEERPKTSSQSTTRFPSIFGMQANGVSMVSEFIVNPSTSSETLVAFHIQCGQLLDYQLDEKGCLRAAPAGGSTSILAINPEPESTRLEAGKSSVTLRVDVESDWGNDPRTVVFHARRDGVPFASFSPHTVANRILSSVANESCICKERSSIVDVPLHERWQEVDMWNITRRPSPRGGFEPGNRVIIPTAGDEFSALLCLGWLDCDSVIVARECLKCAYSNLKVALTRKGATVALISMVPVA